MVAERVKSSYSLTNASSYDLECIGSVVGVSRGFEYEIPGLTEQEYNDVYKILIRAKIVKNKAHCTYDDILDSIVFIFEKADIRIIDRKNFSFGIVFDSPLTDLQRLIFKSYPVVPVPQAVSFIGYNETGITNTFGDGKTFGAGQTFSSYFGF